MSEKYYFSPSTNAFYPESLKPDYDIAGTWPSDGLVVSEEIVLEFSASPNSAGKIRSSDSSGIPAWVDPPELTAGQLASKQLIDAQVAYNNASNKLIEIQQQIDDSDYNDTDTESSLTAEKIVWTDYRKLLRAYLKTDGSNVLPVSPA